ncbi:MAG: helix-turn-helix transcriptional regulator [Candidatus Kapabacteria bacterium]|nr:helix-turn-helix transcriptional regulator [Candidatus Kapabacteria bacterium]
MLDIGDRLNEWIASTGFKKYEVAEKVGISVVQLSRILKGKSAMSFRLENAFRSIGADVDWILTGRKPGVEATKGKLLARYFLPDVQNVVIETEPTQDGVNVLIYEIAKAADPVVYVFDEDELEKMDNVIVVQPSKRDLRKAAATPIMSKE